jgi:ADP-ribosylglycohydrolase
MMGSIIGDICGYPYQSWLMTYMDMKTPIINPSCRITDDTVLTIAVADAILTGAPFRDKYLEWWKKYPNAGYGPGFNDWAESGGKEIGKSIGNGATMRISPIGWAAKDGRSEEPTQGGISQTDKSLRALVHESIKPSHDSIEAMDGAFTLAKITNRIIHGHYKRKFDIEQCATLYPNAISIIHKVTMEDMLTWDKSTCRCGVTTPQAINCFLLSDNYEDCIRKSLYSQGDVDTIACMAGGIAEAYYWKTTGELPIPKKLYQFGMSKLPDEMKAVYFAFRDKYNLPKYE